MRKPPSAALLIGCFAAASLVVLGSASCGSFGEAVTKPADGGGGDVAVEPPRPRDVQVQPDWPTVGDLDPTTDLRAAKVVVVVADATDPSRKVERSFALTEKGPYDFAQFDTSNLVDVTIELTEDSGRLLGYGERRRWNLSRSKTVPVATRKRILYFTSDDRDEGQLRSFDLAPPMQAEPAMQERASALPPSLQAPSSLVMTSDGLLLAQAGLARQAGGGGAPQLAVIATGTEKLERTIGLKYALSAALPIGDGHDVLIAPVKAASVVTFSIVDLDTGTFRSLPTGKQGGGIQISSMAASPDGSRVAAVGVFFDGSDDLPYAFTYAVGADTVTSQPLSDLLTTARGVRFTPDGKLLIIAGWTTSNDGSTGALLYFDATTGALTAPTTIRMETGVSRASSLFLGPAGKLAYVGNETQYPASGGSCCGDLRVFDVMGRKELDVVKSGASGPEFELSDVLRLAYGSHRVIAGQSDNGNNVHGAFVELPPDGAIPVAIRHADNDDLGSITAMATPFAARY